MGRPDGRSVSPATIKCQFVRRPKQCRTGESGRESSLGWLDSRAVNKRTTCLATGPVGTAPPEGRRPENGLRTRRGRPASGGREVCSPSRRPCAPTQDPATPRVNSRLLSTVIRHFAVSGVSSSTPARRARRGGRLPEFRPDASAGRGRRRWPRRPATEPRRGEPEG